MANRRYNTQVTNRRGFMEGGSTKKLNLKKTPVKSSPGRTLKKPAPDQKGLKKLPRAVRNKMGYMAKGGRILKPKGPGVMRPKPQDRYGQVMKPKPIKGKK